MPNRFEAFDYRQQRIMQRALMHFRNGYTLMDIPFEDRPECLDDLIIEVTAPLHELENDIRDKCAADMPRAEREE